MVKRIYFFATKNDMINVLSKLEQQLSYEIKYIQCGKTDQRIFSTAEEIPGLGTLKEKHGEISFLIMRKEDEVKLLAEKVIKVFGKADILVNNAGIAYQNLGI